jgi:hypothetical protein
MKFLYHFLLSCSMIYSSPAALLALMKATFHVLWIKHTMSLLPPGMSAFLSSQLAAILTSPGPLRASFE